MNKLKRVPIAIVWLIAMLVSFTFVDYTWVTLVSGRLIFTVTVLCGGFILSAANSDLKFWVPKK